MYINEPFIIKNYSKIICKLRKLQQSKDISTIWTLPDFGCSDNITEWNCSRSKTQQYPQRK